MLDAWNDYNYLTKTLLNHQPTFQPAPPPPLPPPLPSPQNRNNLQTTKKQKQKNKWHLLVEFIRLIFIMIVKQR